jgi:FeS assembly SUF system protein
MKSIPVIQPQPDNPTPASSDRQTAAMVSDPARLAELQGPIVEAIKTVYDPEIPVNIYDLGLIYDILVDASNTVGIRMTLTAPNCPAAQWLPGQVEQKVRAVPQVADVTVDVVFDPPWDRNRMSDAAKLQLGLW